MFCNFNNHFLNFFKINKKKIKRLKQKEAVKQQGIELRDYLHSWDKSKIFFHIIFTYLYYIIYFL